MVFAKKQSFLYPVLIGAVVALTRKATAVDVFDASRDPFSDIMSTSDIPQFITLTFDDAITPGAVENFKPLSNIKYSLGDQAGCNIKATFYVSIEGNTVCSLVKGIEKGGHELATHTYSHQGFPSLQEIQGAKTYLSETCGVPAEDVRGFRAPFLKYNQDTLDRLKQLGFLYDSSIPVFDPDESNHGRQNLWPFTFTQASVDVFGCDGCDENPLAVNEGLWEIPMWLQYKADGSVDIPMDYTSGVTSLLDRNFERRYVNGNRAPLGLFFHAGWLTSNGAALKSWIENILATYDDVYFVTSNELIEWMRNPVPKSQYKQFQDSQTCDGQVPACFPPSVNMCVYGEWNAETCSCECQSFYCLDSSGACTVLNWGGCEPAPPATSPDSSPVAAPVDDGRCCDAGFTGFKAKPGCSSYYQCAFGEVVGSEFSCPAGRSFDESLQTCNFDYAVTCNAQSCADSPTVAPIVPTASPVTPTASPVVPTASPVAPTTSPVVVTTSPIVPTTSPVTPTASPIVPTAAPTTPTSSPVVPTVAPVGPTASPVDPSPTAAPVTSPPTEESAAGCCTQDYTSCHVTWCGNDRAGCEACSRWATYYWMEDGPPVAGTCVGNWAECTSGETCCPGLVCSGSPGDYYRQCRGSTARRMLRGE